MKNVVDHDSFSVGLLELVMPVLYNAKAESNREGKLFFEISASALLCE